MENSLKVQNLTVSIVLDALILSLLAVGPAIAEGNGAATHFEAIDVACATFEGNGELNFAGIVLSDDPRIAGTSEIEITFVDQQVFVNATFFPAAFDGAWIVPGHSTDTPGAPVVHHGYGVGELAGQTIVFRAAPQPDLVLDNPPCDDPMFVPVKSVGTIIDLPNR